MARGWESKSVEAQQEEVAHGNSTSKTRLTREEAAHTRELEGLRLTLRNVLQQLDRSHDERLRSRLEQAKLDLEQKIGKLEG